MKLYKDYKEEQELMKKEQEDRENLGIPSEVAIIYETPKVAVALRKIVNVLLLVLLMSILGVGVIAIVFYMSML